MAQYRLKKIEYFKNHQPITKFELQERKNSYLLIVFNNFILFPTSLIFLIYFAKIQPNIFGAKLCFLITILTISTTLISLLDLIPNKLDGYATIYSCDSEEEALSRLSEINPKITYYKIGKNRLLSNS